MRVCKEALRILVFTLLVLLVCACDKAQQSSEVKLEYDIAPKPPRVGTAFLELKLTHGAGQPVSGARVELEGNMSHPGMNPVSGETKEVEPGRYTGTLQLTMAGDWIVLVHITLSDGQRLQRQIEINGVRSQ